MEVARDWWETTDRDEFRRRLQARASFYETQAGREAARIVDQTRAQALGGGEGKQRFVGVGVPWSAS